LEAPSVVLGTHPVVGGGDHDKPDDAATVRKRLHERVPITREVVHPEVAGQPSSVEPNALVRRETSSSWCDSSAIDRNGVEMRVRDDLELGAVGPTKQKPGRLASTDHFADEPKEHLGDVGRGQRVDEVGRAGESK